MSIRRISQSMHLQPGHAGHVIHYMVFFNGALIRTLGTGVCLTPVANNARGHLLAKLLYVATLCMRRIINYRLKFTSKTNCAGYRARPALSLSKYHNKKKDINTNVRIVPD